MAIDYSRLAIPKGPPSVLTKGWKIPERFLKSSRPAEIPLKSREDFVKVVRVERRGAAGTFREGA